MLVAIVWGYIGVEYGVPNLFWHEDQSTQILAGIGSAWLLGQLCFVGYLLAQNAEWMKNRSLRWYLLVTWLPLLVVLALRAVIRARGSDLFSETFNEIQRWPFVVGLAAGALSAIMLLEALDNLAVFERFQRWLKRKSPAPDSAGKAPKAGDHLRRTPAEQFVRRRRMQAVFFGFLLVVYGGLACSPLGIAVFPALALCLLLGLVIAVYSFVVLRFPRSAYLVFGGLVIVVVAVNQAPDKHRFPSLESHYDSPQPLDNDSYSARRDMDCGLLNNEEALKNWLTYYRTNHAKTPSTKPKLVVVTASGGGIRSALWTAVVLSKLEEDIPGFFYHVRLITGASGGMLGTAFFTAKLDQIQEFDRQQEFRADEAKEPRRQNMIQSRKQKVADVMNTEGMKNGGLRQVAQHWVLRDAPALFSPFPYYHDRGWALEKAWQKNLAPALGHSVRSLQAGEKEGWRPSLVFSPMLVEDGRRLLISNLDLKSITESGGSLFVADDDAITCDGSYSLSAVEFYRLFPTADEFQISTAVRMSASFPYVSPAAALPTSPSRRVVDAGYYDNFGVNTAAVWIYDNRDWLRENTSGIVVVQIRDKVSQTTRHALGQEDKLHPPSWWQRGLGEVLTPVEGALGGLQAAMQFRSDEQLQVLSQLFNDDEAESCGFFTTVIIQCPVTAALSWYLTDAEYRKVVTSVDGQIRGDRSKFLALDAESKEIIHKNKTRVKSLQTMLEPP
jgi:predicted acylesterase/phospholipase RssA